MNSNDLDRELFELISPLPWTAKKDLLAVAGWMSSALYLQGGPYDGYPVVGKPELVEQTEYKARVIHVYRRKETVLALMYQGSRPCCDDPKCACIFGKSHCIHHTGEVTRGVELKGANVIESGVAE